METVGNIFIITVILLSALGSVDGLYAIGKPRQPLTATAWLISNLLNWIFIGLVLSRLL